MSFNLPQDIVLQGRMMPRGRVTMVREENIYKFLRYQENKKGFFVPINYGYLPIDEGTLFFQKIFKIDLIEEADNNI